MIASTSAPTDKSVEVSTPTVSTSLHSPRMSFARDNTILKWPTQLPIAKTSFLGPKILFTTLQVTELSLLWQIKLEFLGRWKLSDRLMDQLEDSRLEKTAPITKATDGPSPSCTKTTTENMQFYNHGKALRMTLHSFLNSRSLEQMSHKRVRIIGMI